MWTRQLQREVKNSLEKPITDTSTCKNYLTYRNTPSCMQ